MIISKLIFTEEEKEKLKNPEKLFTIEIEMIDLTAKQRYISSFLTKLSGHGSNTDLECSSSVPPLTDSDKEIIKQAILADVDEILDAITKKDIENYLKHCNLDWISFSDRSDKEKNTLIRMFRESNYQNCGRALRDILKLQLSACRHYGLDNVDISELMKKKTIELYEISLENIDEIKIDLDENEILPIIQKTKIPESVLYPLWKPTYELFDNFPIGRTKKINMESEKDRRKGKTANLLMLLNFDELKGVQISRTLTIYDKNVWNACANLVKCGCDVVTATQIYKFMGHTSEPNKREKDKILESINTISRARVFISNKEEHALYEKYDEIVLDTPLLAAEICKATIGDDIIDEAIRIIEPPKLFAIAEQRGQITTIPFEVLKSPINKNDDVSLITDYLLIRISRMKNNKYVTRTILLDTICEKCGIDNSGSGRVKKHRLPDRLERILSHYKSIGWISDYKLTDREIEIIISEKK